MIKKPNLPELTYGKLIQVHYFKFLYGVVELKIEVRTMAYLWSLEHYGLEAYYGPYIGVN